MDVRGSVGGSSRALGREITALVETSDRGLAANARAKRRVAATGGTMLGNVRESRGQSRTDSCGNAAENVHGADHVCWAKWGAPTKDETTGVPDLSEERNQGSTG